MSQLPKHWIVIFSLFLSFRSFGQQTYEDSSSCILLVEVNAEFPGGPKAWNKYLQKKLNVDIPKLNRAPEGTYTVLVQFLITKTGSIDSVKATTNCGYGMESEAVRLIQQSPKWIPGIKKGRNTTEWKKQAITFTVGRNS